MAIMITKLSLHLHGPARLCAGEKLLPLRRKSLALLYYLALEGPQRREFLSDLLWERERQASNLRVELHHLHDVLQPLGILPFVSGQDPLVLPAEISLAPLPEIIHDHAILDGLDDISPDYQSWLDSQRIALAGHHPTPMLHQDLKEMQARQISYPSLLIVEAPPDDGQKAFAYGLANRLGLPFFEGFGGTTKAVRYLNMPLEADGHAVQRIVQDQTSVWVIGCSCFGEDPMHLLALRSLYPAEKTHYLSLPAISWIEAREKLMQGLSFQQAASAYLASGGHIGYLQELLQCLPQEGNAMPLPQKVRAEYLLEARKLADETRFALERLSVHPAPLPLHLIDDLNAEVHLDTLERLGWLRFDNTWRFIDEVARHVIYDTLKEGQRQHYHHMAEASFAVTSTPLAELYHAQQAHHEASRENPILGLEPWASRSLACCLGNYPKHLRPRTSLAKPGVEHVLLELDIYGSGISQQDQKLIWTRQRLEPDPGGAIIQMPEDANLLHLQGHNYVHNILCIGLSGQALPLHLSLQGQTNSVSWAEFTSPQVQDQQLTLPLNDEIDVWLRLPEQSHLKLESAAEMAVIELELTAFQETSDGEAVDVFDV